MKVILQPCGNDEAYRHYLASVATRVKRERILSQLSAADAARIATSLGPRNNVAVWGVEGLRNHQLWEKIRPGDFALFARDNSIFSSGIVLDKAEMPDLARELWGRTSWRYVYFLDDIRPQHMTYMRFNKTANYKPRYRVRNFRILDQRRSDAVLQALGHKNEAPLDASTDPNSAIERALLAIAHELAEIKQLLKERDA